MREIILVPQTLDFTCGAACLASALQYFGRSDASELSLAEELGTLRAEFTPPENIVALAREYGFCAEMTTGNAFKDLQSAVTKPGIIFVTWWDEDAGHYSLVQNLGEKKITLMDPWLARKGCFNELSLDFFLGCWQMRGSRIIHMRILAAAF